MKAKTEKEERKKKKIAVFKAPFDEGCICFGYRTFEVKQGEVVGLTKEDPHLAELLEIFSLKEVIEWR